MSDAIEEPTEETPEAPSGLDVRQWWPVLAQALGVVAIAVGFGVLALWAGFVAGGFLLVAAGTVAEIGRREDD
jgi:hypothetical protein